MTPDDVDRLQSYLDGGLTDGTALEARLKTEPDLADVLLRLAHDDAVLHEWAQAEAGPMPSVQRFAARTGNRAALLAGLAAVVAAALGILPGSNTTLARLEALQGEVRVRAGDADRPARPGEQLIAGQQVRTVGPDSSAVVRYGEAARLELGSDTHIRIGEAAWRVFLNEGVVVADVTSELRGGPLVLRTPHAEALGRGRFQFSSVADATLVESGGTELRLTRTSDGRTISVPPDSYAVARPRAEPFAPHRLPPRLSSARFVIPEAAFAVAYSPEGRWLATGGPGGTVKLWEAGDGQPVRTLPPAKRAVRALRFSPDGRYLAFPGDERTVRLYGVGSEAMVSLTRPTGRGETIAFAFSGSGQSLVTLTRLRHATEVQRWDVAARDAANPVVYAGRLTDVAHDPKTRTFAVAGIDDFVTVLNGDGTLQSLWRADQSELRAIAYSPNGRHIATAGADATIKLWDATTGALIGTLIGHLRAVTAVTYSPDGKVLASVGDGSVKLWDLATGAETTTIRGPRHAVVALAFSHDGHRLATAGSDKTVRVWDLTR